MKKLKPNQKVIIKDTGVPILDKTSSEQDVVGTIEMWCKRFKRYYVSIDDHNNFMPKLQSAKKVCYYIEERNVIPIKK